MEQITLEGIRRTYGAWRQAIEAHAIAAQSEAVARDALSAKQVRLTAQGVEGANKEQREARVQEQVAEERERVRQFESVTRSCQLALRMAELEVESLRLQMRLLESTAAAQAMRSALDLGDPALRVFVLRLPFYGSAASFAPDPGDGLERGFSAMQHYLQQVDPEGRLGYDDAALLGHLLRDLEAWAVDRDLDAGLSAGSAALWEALRAPVSSVTDKQ